MTDRTSQIFDGIREVQQDKSHQWEALKNKEGVTEENCKRCAKFRSQVANANGTLVPCTGIYA